MPGSDGICSARSPVKMSSVCAAGRVSADSASPLKFVQLQLTALERTPSFAAPVHIAVFGYMFAPEEA